LGFKYLGYFLKTGLHKVEDWSWLLAKVENRIGHWCYRWLSLGERSILCKLVLESQPIYWMSLAAIHFSILNKLRKIMYNFLWNWNSETHHYHLCHWETLAKPKHSGGWGFQNILSFSKTLVVNTLWCILIRDGIWHKVIKYKYLPFTTVKNWIKSASFHQPRASKI